MLFPNYYKWSALNSVSTPTLIFVPFHTVLSISTTIFSFTVHMNPVVAVSSVLSAVLVVKKWLDAIQKKEQAIADLSTTVNLVYLTLSPLDNENTIQNLQPSVVAGLVSIGEVLSRIKDRLTLWKEKDIRANKLLSFVTPSRVTDDLRDDAQLLSHHLIAISVALQVSAFLQEQSDNRLALSEQSLWDVIKNAEVRRFWHEMVGPQVSRDYGHQTTYSYSQQVFHISEVMFQKAITAWLQEDLSESLLNSLLLRLDEFGPSGKSRKNLSSLADLLP
jgi:hypothetical protein